MEDEQEMMGWAKELNDELQEMKIDKNTSQCNLIEEALMGDEIDYAAAGGNNLIEEVLRCESGLNDLPKRFHPEESSDVICKEEVEEEIMETDCDRGEASEESGRIEGEMGQAAKANSHMDVPEKSVREDIEGHVLVKGLEADLEDIKILLSYVFEASPGAMMKVELQETSRLMK